VRSLADERLVAPGLELEECPPVLLGMLTHVGISAVGFGLGQHAQLGSSQAAPVHGIGGSGLTAGGVDLGGGARRPTWAIQGSPAQIGIGWCDNPRAL